MLLKKKEALVGMEGDRACEVKRLVDDLLRKRVFSANAKSMVRLRAVLSEGGFAPEEKSGVVDWVFAHPSRTGMDSVAALSMFGILSLLVGSGLGDTGRMRELFGACLEGLSTSEKIWKAGLKVADGATVGWMQKGGCGFWAGVFLASKKAATGEDPAAMDQLSAVLDSEKYPVGMFRDFLRTLKTEEADSLLPLISRLHSRNKRKSTELLGLLFGLTETLSVFFIDRLLLEAARRGDETETGSVSRVAGGIRRPSAVGSSCRRILGYLASEKLGWHGRMLLWRSISFMQPESIGREHAEELKAVAAKEKNISVFLCALDCFPRYADESFLEGVSEECRIAGLYRLKARGSIDVGYIKKTVAGKDMDTRTAFIEYVDDSVSFATKNSLAKKSVVLGLSETAKEGLADFVVQRIFSETEKSKDCFCEVFATLLVYGERSVFDRIRKKVPKGPRKEKALSFFVEWVRVHLEDVGREKERQGRVKWLLRSILASEEGFCSAGSVLCLLGEDVFRHCGDRVCVQWGVFFERELEQVFSEIVGDGAASGKTKLGGLAALSKTIAEKTGENGAYIAEEACLGCFKRSESAEERVLCGVFLERILRCFPSAGRAYTEDILEAALWLGEEGGEEALAGKLVSLLSGDGDRDIVDFVLSRGKKGCVKDTSKLSGEFAVGVISIAGLSVLSLEETREKVGAISTLSRRSYLPLLKATLGAVDETKGETEAEIAIGASRQLCEDLGEEETGFLFRCLLSGSANMFRAVFRILEAVGVSPECEGVLESMLLLGRNSSIPSVRESADNGREISRADPDSLVKSLDAEGGQILLCLPGAVFEAAVCSGRTEETLRSLTEKYSEKIRSTPRWHLKTEGQRQKREVLARTIFLFSSSESFSFTVFSFLVWQGLSDPSDEICELGFECGARIVENSGEGCERHVSELRKSTEKENRYINALYIVCAKRAPLCSALFEECLERTLGTIEDPFLKTHPSVKTTFSEMVARMGREKQQELIDRLLGQMKKEKTHVARKKISDGLGVVLSAVGICSVEETAAWGWIQETVSRKDSSVSAKLDAICLLDSLWAVFGQAFEPFSTSLFGSVAVWVVDDDKTLCEETEGFLGNEFKTATSFCVEHTLSAVFSLLEEKSTEKTKAAIKVLSVASCLPRELLMGNSRRIFAHLAECLNETDTEIRRMACRAAENHIQTAANPEVRGSLSAKAIEALLGKEDDVVSFLRHFTEMSFSHYIDGSALAIIVPPVLRGLYSRRNETRVLACRAVRSLCVFGDSDDVDGYVEPILDGLYRSISDPVAEIRAAAAKAFGVIGKFFKPRRGSLILHFISRLKQGGVSSERAGSAQALTAVMKGSSEEDIGLLTGEIEKGMCTEDVRTRDGMCVFVIYGMKPLGEVFARLMARLLPFLVECVGSSAQLLRDTSKKAFEVLIRQAADEQRREEIVQVLLAGTGSENQNRRVSSFCLVDFFLRCLLSPLAHERPEMDDIPEDFLSTFSEKEKTEVRGILGEEAFASLSVLFYIGKYDRLSLVKNISAAYWAFFSGRKPTEMKRNFSRILATLFVSVARKGAADTAHEEKVLLETARRMTVESLFCEFERALEENKRGREYSTGGFLLCGRCGERLGLEKHHEKTISRLLRYVPAVFSDESSLLEGREACSVFLDAVDRSRRSPDELRETVRTVFVSALGSHRSAALFPLFSHAPRLFSSFVSAELGEESQAAVEASPDSLAEFLQDCFVVNAEDAAAVFNSLSHCFSEEFLCEKSSLFLSLFDKACDVSFENVLRKINTVLDGGEAGRGLCLLRIFCRTGFSQKKVFNRMLLFERWLKRCVELDSPSTVSALLDTIDFQAQPDYPFQVLANVVDEVLQGHPSDETLHCFLEVFTRALFSDCVVFSGHAVLATAERVLTPGLQIPPREAVAFTASLLRVMNTRLDDGSRECCVRCVSAVLGKCEDSIRCFFPQIRNVMLHALFEWNVGARELGLVEGIFSVAGLESGEVPFAETRRRLMDTQSAVGDKARRAGIYARMKQKQENTRSV
ncbi:MAG: translational activator GCN1 [Amphiamblys sp. WSBS2006]|nr:MAG: translational activator GCN1 [Amphiamblys sp. WSBS2006]